ncbi:YqaJ viral recombinase family protein [Nocardia sp. NPDC049707]|uniref:YqaJ viral recombinase family protein n=1 Tax=Nocardia sp. NPDC049707 TaxID=3154735 RepID=UPI003440FFDC
MTSQLVGHLLAETIEPGSPAWWSKMSASKVGAVLGLSRWDSPFSTWHKMAGNVPPEPQNDEQARGHYLEPAIRAWFADQHPDWDVRTTGTWQHNQRDWQIASPDGEVWIPSDVATSKRLRLLECKTDAEPDPEWGVEGTGQIPSGYRAQVMWTMDTIGATTTHVVVLSAYLTFREYVVHYDANEAAAIRARVAAFMDTLPTGKNPQLPDLDNHAATYQAVRALNPNIIDEEIDLSEHTALRYLNAIDAEAAAIAEKIGATAQLAQEMGDSRYGRFQKVNIARRQQKRGGTPYITQTGKRPDLQEEAAA